MSSSGRVRALSRGIPLTYFEILTAVAARHFLEKRVDAPSSKWVSEDGSTRRISSMRS